MGRLADAMLALVREDQRGELLARVALDAEWETYRARARPVTVAEQSLLNAIKWGWKTEAEVAEKLGATRYAEITRR